MSAELLLHELCRVGVIVQIRDGKLRCGARPGVMSDELQARIKAHRVELIRILSGQNRGSDPASLRIGASAESVNTARHDTVTRPSPVHDSAERPSESRSGARPSANPAIEDHGGRYRGETQFNQVARQEVPRPEQISDFNGPFFDPNRTHNRFRCRNPYCLHPGTWWLSRHGVVNCMNCRPPAFPGLVVAKGNAVDAPEVCPDRSWEVVTAPVPNGP